MLSLLSTLQPRPGRAATLRDSATSEKNPVQLDQPAAGAAAAHEGARSFATEAWLQPSELTKAAGALFCPLLTRMLHCRQLYWLQHVIAFRIGDVFCSC